MSAEAHELTAPEIRRGELPRTAIHGLPPRNPPPPPGMFLFGGTSGGIRVALVVVVDNDGLAISKPWAGAPDFAGGLTRFRV